jgi:flagellar basal-body rod modification protein FlgD
MLNTSQNSSSLAAPPVQAMTPGKNAHAKGAQAPGATAADAKTGVSKPDSAKNSPAESQDRFLKLLVTQMKNQDPLNPMDNAQVTSQMAQLSTVSGIDKLNATLNALSSSMTASQSMQASSMIGHVVVVPGNKIELKGGKAAAALDMAQPADNVTVQIKDAAGNLVRSINMGSQPSGIVQLQWDGKNDANADVAAGEYQFTATSQLGGAKSSVNTLSYGLVSGVIQKPEGASLNVEHIGETSMDTVKQIL